MSNEFIRVLMVGSVTALLLIAKPATKRIIQNPFSCLQTLTDRAEAAPTRHGYGRSPEKVAKAADALERFVKTLDRDAMKTYIALMPEIRKDARLFRLYQSRLHSRDKKLLELSLHDQNSWVFCVAIGEIQIAMLAAYAEMLNTTTTDKEACTFFVGLNLFPEEKRENRLDFYMQEREKKSAENTCIDFDSAWQTRQYDMGVNFNLKYGRDFVLLVSDFLYERYAKASKAASRHMMPGEQQDAMLKQVFGETGMYAGRLAVRAVSGKKRLEDLRQLTFETIAELRMLEILAFMEERTMLPQEGWEQKFEAYKRKIEDERRSARARKLFYYVQLPVAIILSPLALVFAILKLKKCGGKEWQRRK